MRLTIPQGEVRRSIQKKGDSRPPLPRRLERLCEAVIHAYGDCPDLRKLGARKSKPTLGEEAARSTCSRCATSVGKVVPEIVGEDLDVGRPIKLSDFRGKVGRPHLLGDLVRPVHGDGAPRARPRRQDERPPRSSLIGVNERRGTPRGRRRPSRPTR